MRKKSVNTLLVFGVVVAIIPFDDLVVPRDNVGGGYEYGD